MQMEREPLQSLCFDYSVSDITCIRAILVSSVTEKGDARDDSLYLNLRLLARNCYTHTHNRKCLKPLPGKTGLLSEDLVVEVYRTVHVHHHAGIGGHQAPAIRHETAGRSEREEAASQLADGMERED